MKTRSLVLATLMTVAVPLVAVHGCSSGSSAVRGASPAPGDAGLDADALATAHYDFASLDAFAFAVGDAAAPTTDGVVIRYKDRVVYERYANGFDANKRHILYSVSKSIGSAIVGLLVRDGLMKVEESVCTYLKIDGADPTLCDTTIEQLLHMESGLSWSEDYGSTSSTILRMLYGDQPDMGAYAAKQKREVPTGTRYQYSSGDANMLAAAVRSALGNRDATQYVQEQLFAPAGISSAIFEKDKAGSFVFSSSCFMTPRDAALFGQLYVDGGKRSGAQILPESWVKRSATPSTLTAAPTARGSDAGTGGGAYGAQFWLNAAGAGGAKETLEFPDAPDDLYSAEGHWGQAIHVVPSRQAVLVRVGNDREQHFDNNQFIKLALGALSREVP